MALEDKMDYLVENSEGKLKEYIHDLINAYYRLQYDLEAEKEEYKTYRDNSRPLTQYEQTGMRDADFR